MRITAKKKMQTVDFRSVDEFLDFLPEDERKVVDRLRRLVFDCIPNVTEKLSFNVPYYRVKSNICFIWPASVLWGKKKTYEGVRFGFTSGYLLQDEVNYLDKGDRKNVYWKDFTSVSMIDDDLLKVYLHEAVVVDQMKKIKG